MYAVNRYVSRRRTMHQRSSRRWLASSLALVLTLLAGCMPIQPPATNLAASKAITLHFAVSDGSGYSVIDPYVHEFVDQVHALSQGKITIEPVWDAGSGTPDGYEKGVIQLVRQGKFDLGLASARTWDTQGIKNFQVLQAPFLITNDALTDAVATSDIATRILNSLSPAGLVGLTLWPEGLRHPFSVVPDKPLLSPQDFVGAQIRTPSSEVAEQLMKALGARPMSGDSGYQGADSGLLAVGTLRGKTIATGNVTFYPKFQVIFANAAAFARLREEARTVLRQAAAAAQKKAIAERPKEVDSATAYCANGGTIVLASAEQVAAFEKAAQPIFDQLAQDPANAAAIAAIRALKAKTPPSPAAVACAPTTTAKPTSVQPTSAPTATVPVTSTASISMPRIVFSSHRDGNMELYLMNADGSGQTRLTNNPAWDNEPTASRDGKRIAFVSDRDGNDEIYAMNVDGSDVVRLTNNQAVDGLPAFSPDGTQLVFFSERDGNVEIYRMNADGSDQTNLTNNPGMDHYPSWSPDGKQILFNSARDGDANFNEVLDPNGEVYVMNADGSGQTRLTDDGVNDGRPMWSPDGKQIIFDTDRGDSAELYVMNADGSHQTQLTHNGQLGAAAWSFDGKQISFTSNRTGDDEIYVMNADGTNPTAITHSPGQDIWAAWLPGSMPTATVPVTATASVPMTSTASANLPRIVFVSHPEGNTDSTDTNAEISIMNADGSGQTRLTNNHLWDNEPSASPDGKRIAFVSGQAAPGSGQIYAMNADGSNVMRLTNNAGADDLPIFSPDGKQIVFFSDRDGNSEIYVMNADGSGQTRLTNNPAIDELPSWSPDGKQIIFNSTRDGGAGNYEIRETNGEIYVMNADGSDQTRLTHDGGQDGRPMWSPDGKKILFDTNRDGDLELYVMNADGSNPTNLTNNPNADAAAVWSLDGQQIAFTSTRDGGDLEIYVMNADGSNQTRITHNPGDDIWAAWLPAAGTP